MSTHLAERQLRLSVFLWLGLALLAGIVLRLNYPGDIEYKGDESYTFAQTQNIGLSEPWPWLGMPSSSGVRNPGMSVWVFAVPAKIIGVHTPPGLARMVQIFGIISLLLTVWIGMRAGADRELWLWAAALAAVNPMTILLQRKIWGQSIMPVFAVLFWLGWWFRGKRLGAFWWGLIGACLGQIHMSGFFQAAGVAGWTALVARRGVKWIWWLVGSVLGAWPLVPWVVHVLTYHGNVPARGWQLHELPGLKFIGVWTVDTLGIDEHWAIGHDFFGLIKWPAVGGHPTFLAGITIIALACAGIILWARLIWLFTRAGFRREVMAGIRGRRSQTALALAASFIGYGVLATVLPIGFSRTYLLAAFPIVHLSLAKVALNSDLRFGRRLLAGICVAQVVLAVILFQFLHVNGGTPDGPYGTAYRLQQH